MAFDWLISRKPMSHLSRRPALSFLFASWSLLTGCSLLRGALALSTELPLSPQGCLALTSKGQAAPGLPTDAQEMRQQIAELEKAGRFVEAAARSENIVALKSSLLGSYHPETAASISNLAGLYLRQGRYAKAEYLYQQSLSIYRCALGNTHLDTAVAMSNLAGLYEQQGRYGMAEPLAEEALKIFSSILGDKHRLIAAPLNNLGMLLYDQGRYLEADPLLTRALDIREKELGPQHLTTATSLSNLGLLRLQQRNYTEAERLLKRALAIREETLGPEHPDLANSLNNLAFLYNRQDRFDAALALFQRALSVRTKTLSPEHPAIANGLNNLGMLYWAQQRYKDAEPMFRQALEVRQQALGSEHPETVASLSNLALIELQQSQSAEAEQLLKRLTQGQGQWLRQELPLQPRELRLKLLAQQPNATNLTFALLHQDPASIDLAFDTRLNRQGLLAEIERRQRQLANSSEKTKDLAEWIAGIDQQLASIDTGAEKRTLLQRERRRLEGELNRLLPDLHIKAVSISQVAKALRALAPRGVLVEFQRYRPLQLRDPAAGLWGAPRYVALLLHPDGRIVSLPLGEAGPIDQAVGRALKASASDRPDASELWQRLSDLVLTPLLPELRGVRELFLSPDGSLHRVPFAVLPAPGDRNSLLNQAYQLRLLTTGRDLLRLQQQGHSGSSAVLIANPAYDSLLHLPDSKTGGRRRGARPAPTIAAARTSPVEPGAERQRRSSDLSATVWPPLPGTDREARALAPLLKVTRPITADAATASLVLRQQGPWILHIATHGFFQPDQPTVSAQPLLMARSVAAGTTGLREDPLLRSGLVMAGANHPDADPNDDGYLTAAEVTGMDLNGTQLVTLSACQSGLGDLQTGEGVYGLQRALRVAGARSTLLSLWSVDDDGTRAFMEAYYGRLIRGEGRAEALAQTQAAFRRHANPLFRSLYVWGAFQLSGDWRALKAGNGQRLP